MTVSEREFVATLGNSYAYEPPLFRLDGFLAVTSSPCILPGKTHARQCVLPVKRHGDDVTELGSKQASVLLLYF